MHTSYQPIRTFRTEHVRIRDLEYQVLRWGPSDPGNQPLLVLCHGWMDVAASFQFLVDALQQERAIIAPDWRGFGGTLAPHADHFVFADYLLDLDYLLDHYAGSQPVHLVGHSLGGNIVTQYAGVRPHRIARLVNLEGFGLPATQASEAPQRLTQWLDGVRALRSQQAGLRSYSSAQAVAERLQRNNPRLPQDKAQWLAQHWAAPGADGQWHLRAHAGHKIPSHQLYNADEAMACLRAITAPTLCIEASDDTIAHYWGTRYSLQEYRSRMACLPDVRHATVHDAGHMLHHDQPAALAALIEAFLAGQSQA